jgi:1-acyl-sn-glycerol-3-phosphate acyltransferase
MGALRASAILAGFAALTLPLIPVQEAFIRWSPLRARRLPHWYHKKLCRLVGVRIHLEGEPERDRPVLLVSNHTSWLDILVMSAVAPVSFVAKKEVGGWPGVATLARLQRTIFIDRQRRAEVADAANEIVRRLAAGDAIVLFAEGTSSDGNRVLPFRSSLFAAVKPSARSALDTPGAVVQTASIVYTRMHGLPIGRADRPRIGWYGDMELVGHAWELLKSGPLDVRVRIGAPVPLDAFADRKQLANCTEQMVREHVIRMLRARMADEPVAVRAPPAPPRSPDRAPARAPAAKWR